MGRRTVGEKKDETITIRVPRDLKDRIRRLMVGPYQHLEFQQMVLLLIEKGFPVHEAGVLAENWQKHGSSEDKGRGGREGRASHEIDPADRATDKRGTTRDTPRK